MMVSNAEQIRKLTLVLSDFSLLKVVSTEIGTTNEGVSKPKGDYDDGLLLTSVLGVGNVL